MSEENRFNEENRFSDDGKIHDKQRLKELQALPLERKMQITQTRLIEWYTAWDGKCCVNFSGGKDSTVLADQAAKVCKMLGYKLILWFSDTGLEYPEIKLTVQSMGKYLEDKYGIEVETVIDYPKDKDGKRITFRRVIEECGYPLISKRIAEAVNRVKRKGDKCADYKSFNGEETGMFDYRRHAYLLDAPFNISHKCCYIMKKKPAHQFQKQSGLKPIIAVMACESITRQKNWIAHGCNAFKGNDPISKPMSFWTEQDVLKYIKTYDIPIASVYGEIKQDENGKYYTTGCKRTGWLYSPYVS